MSDLRKLQQHASICLLRIVEPDSDGVMRLMVNLEAAKRTWCGTHATELMQETARYVRVDMQAPPVHRDGEVYRRLALSVDCPEQSYACAYDLLSVAADRTDWPACGCIVA